MSKSRSTAATAAAALLALGLGLSSIPGTSVNAALAEPPADKFVLAIWPQLDEGYQNTPGQLNELAGILWPAFQLSQPIPVPRYDYVTGVGGPVPEAYIAATGTDADIYLTIYPNQGLAAVQDADLLSLALQIRTYQGSGRTVFLRWAPEFSGNWMIYGLQPTEFKAVWTRMYNIIKAEAPDTVIVWSPNVGYSYPFGATFADVPNVADQTALDTNNNGQLDENDDPYSPWYPGDDQVDWIGVSLYYKGPDFQNINQNQMPGFVYDLIHGQNPYYPSRSPKPDWYAIYCAGKPDKACMMSEAGAAYHTLPNLVSSARNTQVEMQRAWWQDSFLNTSFLQQHPRLKAYYQFEHFKIENDGGIVDDRDYRILNNSAVASAFMADLAPLSTNYVWANNTLTGGMFSGLPPNTSAFEITPSGPVVTDTVTVNGTEMVTATYTQFYSGPFVNVSFVGTADPLASPTGTSTIPADVLATATMNRNANGMVAPTQGVGSNAFTGDARSSRKMMGSLAVGGVSVALAMCLFA